MKPLRLLNIILPQLLAILVSCDEGSDCIEPSSPSNKNYPEYSSNEQIYIGSAKSEVERLMSDLSTADATRSSIPSREISDVYLVYDINGDNRMRESSDSTRKPLLCVVNFKNNGGYAITSADSISPMLYALALSGRLAPNEPNCNPGVGTFLEFLRMIIPGKEPEPVYPANPLFPDGIIAGDWKNTIFYENGLCKVKWGQLYPYNMYCPVIDGQRAKACCLSVALGQLMSVYKYPSQYSGFTFDWDEMTKFEKAYNVSEEAKNSIGKLMQFLGEKNNLAVSYGKDQSSADLDNVKRSLRNFGYSNGGSIKDYSTADIVSELIKRNSVVISGYSHKNNIWEWFSSFKVYTGGHSWLAHGLLRRSRTVTEYSRGKLIKEWTETKWYILCNWGWNCDDDGYYLSEVFDTNAGPSFPSETRSSDEDYNYKYKLQTLTGIRK